MKPEKFFYTDGHDVIITNGKLTVKNAQYLLKGILDFNLTVLNPQRLPGLLLTILGVLLITNAFLSFIPTTLFHALFIPVAYYTNIVQLFAGTGIAVIGILYMVYMHKRYALRIATAEGEKNVVVSRQKEYIDQILTAMRKAKLAAFGNN